MNDIRKAAEMALELLENHVEDPRCEVSICKTIAVLRKALSNEFNPDWNQVEALQESLREHMAEIQRLRQTLAQPEQEPSKQFHEWACAEHQKALAQLEQEPVAWMWKDGSVTTDPYEADGTWTKLYTAPPKREWVGLTDEEVEYWRGNYDFFDSALVREVEAKLKEKNGG